MPSKDPKVRERYRTSPKGRARDAGWHKSHYAAQLRRLHAVKTAVGCADCGYNESPYALDFDHVRGEKKVSVTKMVGKRSWDSILHEVAKCDVRCANCHRVRTHTGP